MAQTPRTNFHGTSRPLDQLESEEDILAACQAMYDDAYHNITDRIKQAKKNWLFYLGKDYLRESGEVDWDEDTNYPDWRVRVHLDIVAQIVETLRPIIYRGYPKYVFTADFPEQPAMLSASDQAQPFFLPNLTDADLAGRFNEIFDTRLQDASEGLEYAKLLVDVLLTGQGWRKVVFDHQKNQINAPTLRIDQVFPDPHATRSDLADAKYVICVHEMDAADIERLYGVDESEFGHDNSGLAADGRGVFRRFRSMLPGKSGTNDDSMPRWKRSRHIVYDIWYNQGTPDMIQYGEPTKALKYPRGRHIVIVNMKKVVLDEHSPFWHGLFPVVGYNVYPLPHTPYGRSDIDQATSLQFGANVLHNMLLYSAMLMGSPQWLMEAGSLQSEIVTNEPGQHIITAPGAVSGGKVQRLEPMRVSSDQFELARYYLQYGKEEMGQARDVLVGESPSSQASGVAINNLQAGGMTQQNFKIEMMDEPNTLFAKLSALTYQQFIQFDDPRLAKHYHRGEDLLWLEAIRELLFDVKVESKVDIPHNVLARENLALQRLQAGIIDIMEYIDFTGIKVPSAIRQRIQVARDTWVPGLPPQANAEILLQTAGGGGGGALSGQQQQQTRVSPNDQIQRPGPAELTGVPGFGQGVVGDPIPQL